MAFVVIVAVGLIGVLPCLAADGLELVDPNGRFGTVECTVKAKTSDSARLSLPQDAGVIRVKTRVKSDSLVAGKENWMDGHLSMCFRDGGGKMIDRWLPTLHLTGTTEWTDFEREYVVPKSAAVFSISEANYGIAGTMTFAPVSVTVTRRRMARAVNMPVPEGVKGDPESLDDAWRVVNRFRERICLNGLWRARPVVKGDDAGTVPGTDDAWGWGKIPSVWRRPFDVSKEGSRFDVSRWWEENEIKIDADLQDEWWYRRSFILPKSAAGRRTLLNFTGLATRAQVFIDGVRVGEVTFPGGELDLSRFIRPGTRQTLTMLVTAHPSGKEVLSFNAADRVDRVADVVKLRGVTGDLYLDIVPSEVRIVDVWTETRVEKGEIEFGVAVEGSRSGEAFNVSAEVSGCNDRRTFAGVGKVGADGVVRFSAPWRDAKLWDVHTPENLYSAKVSIARVESPGAVVDESVPFRFGFREVKIRGRDLYLNGTRIHLRALTCAAMARGADRACRAGALDTCRRMKDMGFNFAIANNYNLMPGAISHIDSTLDAFDETGMLYSFTMPHMKDFGNNRFLDDPENVARYKKLAAWAVSRVRRHPSVIAYTTSHNAVGYTGDQNPLKLDGMYDPMPPDRVSEKNPGFQRRRAAKEIASILRELDPTRIVYHHASGPLGDFHTMNIYLNWAPVQERSDWLHDWAARGTKPMFFVEWGCPHIASWSSYRGPLFIWRKPGYHSLWAQEYAAAFRGDAAYEGNATVSDALAVEESFWAKGEPFMFSSSIKDTLVRWESNYQSVVGRYLWDNWRSHRAWGITAMLPWDQNNFYRRTVPSDETRPFPKRYEHLKEPGMVPDVLGGGKKWMSNSYFYDNGPRTNFTMTAMGRALARWNGEDCAFIGGSGVFTDKRHLFRPGEQAAKTLVILNDRRVGQTVKWGWRLFDAKGRVVGSDAGNVSVSPGCRADVPVCVALPDAGEYVLKAGFEFEGDRRQYDEFKMSAVEQKPCSQQCPILLYDTKGLTKAHFDRLGIKYSVISELTESSVPNDQALVIGRESLTHDVYDRTVRWYNRHPQWTWREWRGCVLVFEQKEEVLNQIGFRTQTYGLRQAFPRHSRSVFLGLTDELLRDWAGEATLVPSYLDGVEELETDYTRKPWAGFMHSRVWRCRNRGNVASVLMEKPHRGDWRALCDGAFDLEYSPLLELSVARGRVVFCQLDVTGRTVADPVADEITKALVARVSSEKIPAPCDVKTYGKRAFFAVRDSGFRLNQDPSYDGGKVFAVSSGAKKPKGLDDKVRNGAKVLCLGLSAAEIAEWSPEPIAVAATNGCVYSRIEDLPPELDGLSNADWAWHGRMAFDAFQDPVKDGNAAFRVVRLGKGAYVFWQVPPWKIDEEERPQLRHTRRHAELMLSRLLGNMGARSDETTARYADSPIAEDDPYRYYRW